MKIGLVLEGGAMRGIYTAGVLDTFIENNIEVDAIIGVSAGALFGANYKSNQKGRAIRYIKKYASDNRFMGLKTLFKTGNLVNKEFAYDEIPNKLDPFDYKEFDKNKMKFYATVTNVATGEPEYHLIKDSKKQMEILRASGSMPFVSNVVEYEGNKYLDGALADSIPVNKMKELGYDKIIVVLTKPLGYRKKKHTKIIPKLWYKKYPKLVEDINTRYLRYNQCINEIDKDESLFVIRPSKVLRVGRIEKNPDRLQSLYDLGVSDTKALLKELKEYIKE